MRESAKMAETLDITALRGGVRSKPFIYGHFGQ